MGQLVSALTNGTVDRSCRNSVIGSSKNELLEEQSLKLSLPVLGIWLDLNNRRHELSEGTPEKKEPEVVSDSKEVKDTPEKKEPQDEGVSDRGKIKGLKVVSQEKQTDDLLSIDKEITEHDELEIKSLYKLAKHLEDLLIEDRDHDVIIKVKNRPFKAHKVVLQTRSPVFFSMFRHDMEERASGVVIIDDCDPDVFDQFLRHVYTGKFEMDSAKNAIALHYMADKYDFPALKEACIRYLYNSFSTNTVCDIIKMAVVHDEILLLERASMFFERNLEKILTTEEWQIFFHNDYEMATGMLLQAVLSSRECPSCSLKRE